MLVRFAKTPFMTLQAAEGPSAANAVPSIMLLSTNLTCGLASPTSGLVTACPPRVS